MLKIYSFQLTFLCSVFLFSCKDVPKSNVKIVYYPDTEKIYQQITYLDTLKDGEAKEFFPNGKLKSRRFYVKDLLDDTTFIYHDNGQLRSLQMYKNRKADGIWKEFNPQGKVYSEIHFKDGLFEGTSTTYTYRTGKIQERITFKKGIKDGLEEFYYPNGNPKSKILYNSGEPCRNIEEWYDDGEKVNNDFKISVQEHNDVLMKNTLTYFIKLENPKPDDKVYREVGPAKNDCEFGQLFRLPEENGAYKLQFEIHKGGFVMQEVKIVAFRKTLFGNTCSEVKTFNAASNNF
jgi:antitoxin component YwqK of YwqJK toxin-antitoxin module